MIKHIVMWKLKEEAEGHKKIENCNIIKSGLEDLKSKIPQIISLEVGINTVEDLNAYDLVLYTEFKTQQDLDTYQNHPDHVAVARYIGKVRESRVVVDYEI